MHSSGPSLYSYNSELEEESVFKLTENTFKLKSELENCAILDRNLVSKIQSDFKNAERLIASLRNDKNKLKEALADTLTKKDELYRKAMEFREELASARNKNQEINMISREIQSAKHLINELSDKLETKGKEFEEIVLENKLLKANINKFEIDASS